MRAQLKLILIQFLKGEAIKLALKKLLGSAAAGGIKGWIIKFVVEQLFEEVAQPIIELGFRKMGYLVHRIEGEIILKKIKDAKNENDFDRYRRNIGRV